MLTVPELSVMLPPIALPVLVASAIRDAALVALDIIVPVLVVSRSMMPPRPERAVTRILDGVNVKVPDGVKFSTPIAPPEEPIAESTPATPLQLDVHPTVAPPRLNVVLLNEVIAITPPGPAGLPALAAPPLALKFPPI